MDFATTPEQDKLVDEVVSFAQAELSAGAADNDRNATFDRDAWRRCADFGVLGWPIPQEYGGAGYDAVTCVLAYEALGYGCADNGLVFAVNNHVWACTSYVLTHGSAEQRARYLPGLADGTLIGAHALTEPEAGSDMLALSTTARADGDGYVLDGTKTFISNAPCADLFVLFARTEGPEVPAQMALSAFLVPANTPGVRIAREWDKAGLRGTLMGEVAFEGARLEAAQLLGRPGQGYEIFTATIEWERGFMFASPVGVMQRLLERSIAHANNRRQFGRRIGAFDAVSHKVADMRVRLELARLMLYRFGWLRDQNRLALLESSLLKLHVSESLLASALDAVQLHGARGYLTEFGVERELRDAFGTTIYGGTSEIHRSVIARLSGVRDDS
jgi:alkylation response protein AidB-like acyl-CoA dehydrogenase